MKKVAASPEALWKIFTQVCERLGEKWEKPQRVTIEPVKSVRSLEQNAYLWGVCYRTILEEGDLANQGWRAEDLHEDFLGECFGWERLEGFGRKRLRPVRRSSKMSKVEFSDYLMVVHQKAAELGIVIPDPDPYI